MASSGRRPPVAASEVREAVRAGSQQAVQFSVRSVLVLTGLTALFSSGFQVFPADLYAAAAGALTFVGLFLLSVLKPVKPILFMGWWWLMGVYLISFYAAVSGSL